MEEFLNPEAVIDGVLEVSGLDRETIFGRSRTTHVSHARKILAFLLKRRSRMSYDGIAHIMNGRDHTTIIYYCKECLLMPTKALLVWENQAEKKHAERLSKPEEDTVRNSVEL